MQGESTNRARALLEATRPHQWVKNFLVLAPIALAQQLDDVQSLIAVSLTFVGFCLVASAGYLVNDIFDLEADRQHPTKRLRPLAAGRLTISNEVVAATLLSGGAIGGTFWLVGPATAGMLVAYLIGTLVYSFVLKEKIFLDVLVLAGLYTHRVLTGGVAAEVSVSPWLLAFSIFFFLSLALLKRHIELAAPGGGDQTTDGVVVRRAYRRDDLALVQTMGIASGYLSVLVLGLYVSLEDVTRYYSSPEIIWLVLPLMLYWISRIWFLARRGEIGTDPVAFAIKDPVSYVVFTGVVCVGVGAAFVVKAS